MCWLWDNLEAATLPLFPVSIRSRGPRWGLSLVTTTPVALSGRPFPGRSAVFASFWGGIRGRCRARGGNWGLQGILSLLFLLRPRQPPSADARGARCPRGSSAVAATQSPSVRPWTVHPPGRSFPELPARDESGHSRGAGVQGRA